MNFTQRILLSLLLALATISDVLSQDNQYFMLSGVVYDTDSATVPFASVYVGETMTGTATNASGKYSIKIPRNQAVNLIVQSVGYTPTQLKLEISKDTLMDIVMQTDYIVLDEVVAHGGEDPAYEIMRKAIVNAPLHLNEVDNYVANMYIKGTLKVDKIPKIILGRLGDNMPEVGKTYVMESANRLEYTSPNNYMHILLTEHSSIPQFLIDKDIRLQYFNFNFYNINNDDVVVSPLSNYAFAYYKFVYEGYSIVFGKTINYIKVIPKIHSKQLFKGEIHIVDGTWQLSYVNLILETALGDINVIQNFIPVKRNIWLPVYQNYSLDLTMLGIVGKFDYIGSIDYTSVKYTSAETTLREAIESDESDLLEKLHSKKKVKQYQHNAQKLNEILSNETFTNSNMRHSGRYWRRLNAIADTASNRLEITDRLKYAIIDSSSNSYNETLMASMRHIPLTNCEIQSFRESDSLNISNSQSKHKNNGDKSASKRKILGEQIFELSNNLSLVLSGINANMIYYHPVTGVGLEQELGLRYQQDKFTTYVGFKGGYAVSPRFFMPQVNARISYGKHTLLFACGDEYVDWRGENGDPRFTNSLISFFIKKNHKVFVEDKYKHFDYTSSPIWGLNIKASLHLDDYLTPENHTNFSFFKRKKEFKPNIPLNKYLSAESLANGEQASVSVEFDFTPRLMYYVNGKGEKIAQGSRWPTFNFMFKRSLGSLVNTESDYSQIALKLTRKKNFALTDKVDWEVGAGAMFDASNASFADWKHFAGSKKMIAISDMASGYKGFVMFDAYSLSTNDWYANVALHYQSQSFLIKKIPFLSNWLYTEELFLKSVMFGGKDFYSEIGYGLGHVFLIFRATAFVSFINEKFDAVNLRMSVSIPKLNGK